MIRGNVASLQAWVRIILILSFVATGGIGAAQTSPGVFATMNAGQLFSKADELSERGEKDRAREVLRMLITRFPDHPLATNAVQLLATIGTPVANVQQNVANQLEKDEESKGLARQNWRRERAETERRNAEKDARQYAESQQKLERAHKEIDEGIAKMNRDRDQSRQETSAAWGQALGIIGGAVVDRNAQRRQNEVALEQRKREQLDAVNAARAQQQKTDYDRMAEKHAQFDRDQAQRLAMANQIASNENAAPTAAKINRDEADAALQRRLAQDTLRIAGPSGLKDNGSGPQRRNDERPNDTRGGLTKGDSWGAEDTRKLAREAAERDRQNEIAKQDYWRRRNEEVTRQAAVDEKKWHKDMGDMKKREDEAANAIIRAENAEVNNPNIIKVTSRCFGGIVVVINSYASSTALRGKVSYRVTATDSSGEKIDDTGYWTYEVGPGSYTDNSAGIKADCSKAWKLQVTDNRWWAAR